MRKALLGTVTALALALPTTSLAQTSTPSRAEVYGVKGEDMLKMRAGPGIGYNVIVGLPNGALVRIHKCEQSGSTRWCQVSLDRVRALKGYVSAAYLRAE